MPSVRLSRGSIPDQALAIGQTGLTSMTRMSLLLLDLAVVSKIFRFASSTYQSQVGQQKKGPCNGVPQGLKHKPPQGGGMTNVQSGSGGQGRYSVVFSR